MVGLTGDDLAEARRLWSYQQGLGLPITPLRPVGAARPRAGARPAGARRRGRAPRPPGRPAAAGRRAAGGRAAGRRGAACRGRSTELSDVDARRHRGRRRLRRPPR